MKDLWTILAQEGIDEFHYACSIEPDACYKWRGWKDEIDRVEMILREQIAKEIENAVIETVGNSAATIAQAAAIARGQK